MREKRKITSREYESGNKGMWGGGDGIFGGRVGGGAMPVVSHPRCSNSILSSTHQTWLAWALTAGLPTMHFTSASDKDTLESTRLQQRSYISNIKSWKVVKHLFFFFIVWGETVQMSCDTYLYNFLSPPSGDPYLWECSAMAGFRSLLIVGREV